MSDNYRWGYKPGELRRLKEQHGIWLQLTRKHLDAGGARAGDVVLDLGCGPGFVTTELAARGARVLAYDRNARSLSYLRKRCKTLGLRSVRVLPAGDVRNLPALGESLTAVYMRWLLCYLDTPTVERLLSDLHGRLRSGGRLLIHDYVDYCSAHAEPPSEEIQLVIAEFHRGMENPDIGSTLPDIVKRSGFKITWEQRIALAIAPGDAFWRWPDQFFRLHVPKLVGGNRDPAHAGLPKGWEPGSFLRDWERLAANRDARFHAWPVLQLVAEKQ